MTVTINASEQSKTWALYGATGAVRRHGRDRQAGAGARHSHGPASSPHRSRPRPTSCPCRAARPGNGRSRHWRTPSPSTWRLAAVRRWSTSPVRLLAQPSPWPRRACARAWTTSTSAASWRACVGCSPWMRWRQARALRWWVVRASASPRRTAWRGVCPRCWAAPSGCASRSPPTPVLHSAAVAESTLEVLSGGGHEVADGRLVQRRLARLRWQETAPNGEVIAFASAPLADLVGALHAASAREVVAGVPMPAAQACVIAAVAPLLPLLLRIPAARRQLANTGGHAASGASHSTRRSRAWVSGWRGDRALGLMMEAGEGFAVAADMAIHALQAHLARRPAPGAYTPATAYGARWLDDLPGIRVSETHPSEERHPARPRHRQQPPPDLRRLAGRLLGHDVRKQKTTL